MVHLDPEDWERLDKKKFLAWGGAFTAAVDLVLYPLELVKTRIQVDVTVRRPSSLV
jgi:hypothetical protein